MKRPHAVAVAFIVAAGWLLRAWPALSFGGWWHVPVGYDDAVYFSSSALLWRGEMPYRDFVMVHPPGLLLFLAPLSALVKAVGAAQAFSLARWLMTFVGAASILLSARVAYRVAGPVAAIAAAFFYAVFPETVLKDRSPYLEPLLNLACLLLANAWLSDRVERRPRWALAAGLCLGFAASVKLWAAIWAAACLASLPNRRALGWLVLGAAGAAAVMVGPFLFAAPRAFVEQVIEFQIWRPADGMAVGLDRVTAAVQLSWPIAVLALFGLTAASWKRAEPAEWRSVRFFGAAWILLVIAFLTTRAYWPDYNAHLAPAEAHLAGLGTAYLWHAAAPRSRLARLATVALMVATAWFPLRYCLEVARIGGGTVVVAAARIRREIPEDACYFAFDPAWVLVADRLPSSAAARRPIADVYATMLLASWESSARTYPTARQALLTRPAQARIREILAGCEFLSLGYRGAMQLTARTRGWIARRWEEIDPADHIGVDLWRLRQAPSDRAAPFPASSRAPRGRPGLGDGLGRKALELRHPAVELLGRADHGTRIGG